MVNVDSRHVEKNTLQLDPDLEAVGGGCAMVAVWLIKSIKQQANKQPNRQTNTQTLGSRG